MYQDPGILYEGLCRTANCPVWFCEEKTVARTAVLGLCDGDGGCEDDISIDVDVDVLLNLAH